MDVRDAAAEYRVEPLTDVAVDDVPAGYQRTEIGIIPEDWRVCNLTQLADVLAGLTYRPTDVADDGVLVLRSSNIQNDRLTYDDNVFVAASVVPPSVLVRDGDVLVCVRNGSRELIGKSAVIRNVSTPTAFGAFMAVLRAPEPWFAYYTFQSACVERQIHEQLGATINQITGSGFKAFQVAYPVDRSERTAIAEALSDADALIESLQQLIAKQRAIKQGAMQALLTGRQRLPGFSGEWQTKRLDELAEIRSGGTPSTARADYWDGDILWCTPTDITALAGHKYLVDTTRKITALGLKASSAESIPAHSIVMTSRATIGVCAINQVPVTTNQGFKNLVPRDRVDAEFLYYLLCIQTAGLVSLCGGSTFLEVSKKQVAAYEVEFPATKLEQTAIAAVLSDMDAAIDALEARLAKTRALKAGMMQQLLTGRIRLVPRGRAHA